MSPRATPEAKPVFHKGICKRVTDYALLGASNAEIADLIGIHINTFDAWAREYPSFALAIRRGREDAVVRVVKSAHRAANGYSHPETKLNVVDGKLEKTVVTKHYPPNVAAIGLILTNRASAHWKDTKTVEHSGRIDLSALVRGSMGDEAKVIEGKATTGHNEPQALENDE